MSTFFSTKHRNLTPYTPGEQPKDQQYVKLNTNESPFPPSENVIRAATEAAARLQLYSDPDCTKLTEAFSAVFDVGTRQVIFGNGSDELLNFAFAAFGDEEHPFAFPNISYGFYPVFAEINHVPFEEIPLRDDFSIDASDYYEIGKNIVIANPNAPTGLTVTLDEIAEMCRTNPGNVVVIDEAYVDFGGDSAMQLIGKFPNLLVVGTFSKSRSLAGARLGFAVGNEALIIDLNTIKYSTNPYNVNSITIAAGAAALERNDYYMENCRTIMDTRAWTKNELERLGFSVLDSKSNFLFARSKKVGGETLYRMLKERGVLVRWFDKDLIRDFVRITIGTRKQMERLIEETKSIIFLSDSKAKR